MLRITRGFFACAEINNVKIIGHLNIFGSFNEPLLAVRVAAIF
jgi:hypothetical protein